MRVIDVQNIKLVSVNRKYTIAAGRRTLVLSPEYRNFKKVIGMVANKSRTFTKPVQVHIFHSSNLDVDNPVKCINDGLQECGVLANDKLIKRQIVDVDHKNEGRLTVDIEEIEEV